MTKIVDAADVRQGYNQTRSENLWRSLLQSVGSAGLIRRRRWWVRWLGRAGPLSRFAFFIHFIRCIVKQKNHLAVGGRPYHAILRGYPNRVKGVAFLRHGYGSGIPH